MSKFYITTPIYYVNGAPHIGHAYTTLVADTFARFYRQLGWDVYFQTGTDEHGLKVQREAEKQGITPKELADKNSSLFVELFRQMEISYDRFIRTTEEDHYKTVTEIVRRMEKNGDIYLDKYAGWYAAADEAFYTEDEIEDGRAKSTGSPVEWVEEESYFFRLSKYQEPLLEFYRKNPRAILPEVRYNEVVSFIEGGLKDLSISRTTFQWGIPFPGNSKHILYVWVDALTNYITGVGAFSDPERFKRYWPCDLHLIGKDILRFHAVYWPAFLMSAGLEPPKQIFAHGWWLNEGEKMSKSKGNFLDAFALIREYPLDVLRYYLMREVPFGNDGNFVRARLIERNNSELADNFGNLVNRTFRMTQRFLEGEVPTAKPSDAAEDVELREKAFNCRDAVRKYMDAREPHRALESIIGFSAHLNQYVHQMAPWHLNKKGEKERLAQVLYNALEGVRWLGVLFYSFIPKTSRKVMEALGYTDIEAALSFDTLDNFGELAPGTKLNPPEILFKKMEIESKKPEGEEKKSNNKSEKKEKTSKGSDSKAGDGLVTYEEFSRLDLRVGQIVAAEPIKKSKKLLRLEVDLGEEKPRQVIAGIAPHFTPEELIGKKIAVVANLKPAKLFGYWSEAMLLAAENSAGKLFLTSFEGDIEPGSKIR